MYIDHSGYLIIIQFYILHWKPYHMRGGGGAAHLKNLVEQLIIHEILYWLTYKYVWLNVQDLYCYRVLWGKLTMILSVYCTVWLCLSHELWFSGLDATSITTKVGTLLELVVNCMKVFQSVKGRKINFFFFSKMYFV